MDEGTIHEVVFIDESVLGKAYEPCVLTVVLGDEYNHQKVLQINVIKNQDRLPDLELVHKNFTSVFLGVRLLRFTMDSSPRANWE